MTLEEAIRHCEEVAKEKCNACGAEHKQLAKWMRELKFRRKAMNWMARNVGEIFGESLIEAGERGGRAQAKSISANVRTADECKRGFGRNISNVAECVEVVREKSADMGLEREE